MKHEALTDAISMLDDGLIEEAQQPFHKRRASSAIKLCAAAPACAAAVGAFLLIPRGGSADILIMGEDPSENPVTIRTVDSEPGVIRAFALEYTDIPVNVVSSEKTVISVSAGELYLTGDVEDKVYVESSVELEGNASLLWSVPLWDAYAEYQLTAETGESFRVLVLSFDESTQEWTVKENASPN